MNNKGVPHRYNNNAAVPHQSESDQSAIVENVLPAKEKPKIDPKMSERENNVYKAKLAEQAERYDGELDGLAAGDTRKSPTKSSAIVRPGERRRQRLFPTPD